MCIFIYFHRSFISLFPRTCLCYILLQSSKVLTPDPAWFHRNTYFKNWVSGEVCHLLDAVGFLLHCETTQMCEFRDTDTAKLFHLSPQLGSLLSAVPRQSLWNISSPLRFLLTIMINILPLAALTLRFREMTSSYPTSCLASHESKHDQTQTQWAAESSNLFISILVSFIMQQYNFVFLSNRVNVNVPCGLFPLNDQ